MISFGRIVLFAAVALIWLSPAQSQDVRRPKTESEMMDLSRQIARQGVHCPIVEQLKDEGEDARGQIEKVSCASLDGKNRWFVRRMTIFNSDQPVRYEPW